MSSPRTFARPLLAAALVLAAACRDRHGGGSVAPAADAGRGQATLTVYSGRTEALVAPVIASFEKASGVRVQVKYADTAQLAATLLTEAARSPADVFFAQDASTLALLEQRGVFAELPADALARVPARFRSARGHWLGVSGRARVLAYHPGRVKAEELPRTVLDLTDPRWRRRLGWSPENASFQSFLAGMIQLEGEDATRRWLEAMKANEPRAYPKNAPAVLAVSRGEIDAALTNHYYTHRLRDEHGAEFPVQNHYFPGGDAGAMVNLSGVALLASSARRDAALRFLAHLLGPEAQAHFAAANHEFPLAQGVPGPEGLPALESLRTPEVDLAQLENLEGTVRLLRDTGVLR
jgi:iron(III) transport system substrate-binding protein